MNGVATSVGVVVGVLAAALAGPLPAEERQKAPASNLFQTEVFVSGTEDYHTFRIPALVVTSRGTLLAFCEGRKSSREDLGDNDLMLKRSRDGGRTWGPLQRIYDEGKRTIGNPTVVVDQETNTVWLVMQRDGRDVLLTHSRDDGQTWSEPRDITASVKQPEWGFYAVGPGVGIQVRHGPHRGRLVIPAYHRQTQDKSGPSAAHIFYSDDHGQTWRLGGTAGLHTNECQVVETWEDSQSVLLLNMRNHWARSGGRKDLAGRRLIARSRDGGATWSEPTRDEALIEPTCQASLIRVGAPGGEDSQLLFANPAASSRSKMTVRLSRDEGHTWPTAREVYAGSSAYSSLAALPDGRIGLLYERDNYGKLTFASFTLDWLNGDKKATSAATSSSAAVFTAAFEAASTARLPQEASWQATLYQYLSTLRTQDFAIDDPTFTVPRDYAKEDVDRVYRDWIVLGHLGREPPPAALRAAPEHFTLERIEGEQIRVLPEPASPAWWTQFDYPGNPYAGSHAGQRRALVMAVVDMLMLEQAHREDPRSLKPDFMAANLSAWAYTLHHCGARLPRDAQEAYREGMLHYLAKMERLAPRDENTNMDMRELVALAELDQVFDDDATHRRLVSTARRILFGDARRTPDTSDPRRGTFHPAGYIGEADGPETSYNGISLYHLAEAAMITRGDPDWDAFLPEVIRRMVRFKAYNTFPEPDGSYEGPSSWAKRTNDPYPRDQRDRPWRSFAEAMLTDEALYRLRVNPAEYDGRAWGLASREAMLDDLARGVERLNRHPTRPERWRPEQPPVWQEDHWPADLPYTWDHYVPGSYARFTQLVKERSALLAPPFARAGDFNLSFDGEFWMVKRGSWGFQVEAVPHMGRGYNAGGSGALAGGSLAAFWTLPTGVTVLGRLPDKWNYVTWDKIEAWPTHHLWGRTAAGVAFSSARQREPWVRFETDADPPRVHVLGSLGSPETLAPSDAPEAVLDMGHVYYQRRFTLSDEGLHIHSELRSQGKDQLTELWETLPIYLNDARQTKGADAQLELQAGGTWRPGGADFVDRVEAVRIVRGEGAIVIEFDQPRRVGLSDVIVTSYQKKDRLRNLKIDLLASNGQAAPMPRQAEVGYLIRADH